VDWTGLGLGKCLCRVDGRDEGMIGEVDVDMQGKPNRNWSSGFIVLT
jgi:hypothetical protein